MKASARRSSVLVVVLVAAVHLTATLVAGCSERRQAAQAKPANPPVYAEIVAAPPPPAFIPPAELQVAAPLLAESRLAPPTTSRFPDKAANRATLVSEQSVSTFSVDVDTAAYSFMRRSLAEGALPPPEAVRVEELVNYFPYQYPAPAKRDEPFAVTTTVMPSPWNDKRQLVHIALRGYDVQSAQRPKLNLVLLVDVSGSMAGPDRLPLLQEAFKLFAQQLRDDDRVAIVTYASGTGVALPPTSGRDKQVIIDAIGALGAGGSTAGEEGLQLAYSLAQKHFDSKAVNRVILATDGDFNVGITDPKQLERFIVDKRKTGIYLSVFGVGLDNLNDDLMQRLSQSGNGNAAYIDSLIEARKALVEELGSTMFPIANDVKVQVEFNPAQVAAYRLIGYETRMLARQDFKDDKVDAGDLGAGHTVTALYEITPAAARTELVDPLRYGAEQQATPAEAGDELCFVKVRYKLPGARDSRLIEHAVHAASAYATLDAAPAEQRFAVAVAAFGQRLRHEADLDDFGYERIAALAKAARGADPHGYRAEFINLVHKAQSLSKTGRLAKR